MHIQKITPCLWFEKDLPQVIEYYKSIFKDNLKVVYFGDLEKGPGGEYQFGSIARQKTPTTNSVLSKQSSESIGCNLLFKSEIYRIGG
jgi:predicted 3-demethylubiquinone-9 3-methyltransferase (glyoxalase superfamily)